jgi:hypothetical protein
MNLQCKKWCILPAAMLMAVTVAFAQDSSTTDPKPTTEVGQRKENQQDRIAQGIKSGQLTAGETAKLENQQKNINKQVATDRAANGGRLTAGEKAQVNKEQNKASKNIYNKKHNARTQPGTKK